MKRIVIFLVLASLLAGCASSSRSVRAIRQYEREPADINAVLDRIEDLELCLTLVNRILLETPYSPGDPWVQQVSLDEASATTIEQELRTSSSVYTNRDLRIPVAKVYAVHVERALDANRAVARTAPAKYANVLTAIGDAGGAGQAVLTSWASMDDKVRKLGALAIAIEQLEKARDDLGPNASKAAIGQASAKIDAVEAQADALADEIKTDRQTFLDSLKGLQPGASATPTAEAAQMVSDLTAVVSVAARLELEARPARPMALPHQATPRPAPDGRGKPSTAMPLGLAAMAVILILGGIVTFILVDPWGDDAGATAPNPAATAPSQTAHAKPLDNDPVVAKVTPVVTPATEPDASPAVEAPKLPAKYTVQFFVLASKKSAELTWIPGRKEALPAGEDGRWTFDADAAPPPWDLQASRRGHKTVGLRVAPDEDGKHLQVTLGRANKGEWSWDDTHTKLDATVDGTFEFSTKLTRKAGRKRGNSFID
jgi:hypothetical protein